MDFKSRIPGCHNFYWYEAFRTSHNEGQNRSEFLALPPANRLIVERNIIAIANRLQVARDVLGYGIPIESWFRSARVERLVGGSGANHPLGGAVDPDLTGKRLADFVEFFSTTSGGLGHNEHQAHVDIYTVPKVRRRWNYAG